MENAPIFDTHAHYDDPQFDPDREQLLRRLPDLGVVGVVSCANIPGFTLPPGSTRRIWKVPI